MSSLFEVALKQIGNAVHADTQIPTLPFLASAEFTGSEWIDIRHLGKIIFLLASTKNFDTVEWEWSSDGATANGLTTAFTAQEVDSGPLHYYVYLSLNNLDTVSGTHLRVHVNNGAADQDATMIGIFSVGHNPYLPLIGLTDNLSFFQSALLARAVLAGTTDSGLFLNVAVDSARRLRVMERALVTQSGSAFYEGARVDGSYKFSRDSGAEVIAALQDAQSIGGTVFHDPVEGQAIFSTGATPGNTIFCVSPDSAQYDPVGSMIRGERTIEIPDLATVIVGDADVRWGQGEPDGAGDILNGYGGGCKINPATGLPTLYVWRRKNSIDELDTFDYNKDPLDGGEHSRYGPGSIDMETGTIFYEQGEWLGKAPPEFLAMSPEAGEPLLYHREARVAFGTTYPEPNLPLFVRAKNDSVSGGDVQVRTGSWRIAAFTSKQQITARRADGKTVDLRATDNGELLTKVTDISPNVDLDGLPNNVANQLTVGPNVVPYTTELSDMRALKVVVQNPDVSLFYGFVPTMTPNSKSILVPNNETAFDWTGGTIYFITGSTESSNTQTLSGGASAGTATLPANALASDGAYATIDANAQTVEISSFTFSYSGAFDTIQSLKLGIEAAKQAGQFDQATHVATVTGVAGNVAAVSSALVTAVATDLYLVAVTWADTTDTISSISNTGDDMGWTQVGTDAVGANARTAVYRNTIAPTADFTATAIFSSAVLNSIIAVSRISNVNLTDPIDNNESITGSAASYSDSLIGTAKGNLYVAAGVQNSTHTAGSGSTEQAEATNGTGSNTATLAVTTRELAASGAEAYSGSLSASVGYGIVAITLNPNPAADPVVTLSYEFGGSPGATTQDIPLSIEADTNYTLDITGDESWVAGDIPSITLIVTGLDIASAAALIDYAYLEVIESTTSAITRIYLHELGGPD